MGRIGQCYILSGMLYRLFEVVVTLGGIGSRLNKRWPFRRDRIENSDNLTDRSEYPRHAMLQAMPNAFCIKYLCCTSNSFFSENCCCDWDMFWINCHISGRMHFHHISEYVKRILKIVYIFDVVLVINQGWQHSKGSF